MPHARAIAVCLTALACTAVPGAGEPAAAQSPEATPPAATAPVLPAEVAPSDRSAQANPTEQAQRAPAPAPQPAPPRPGEGGPLPAAPQPQGPPASALIDQILDDGRAWLEDNFDSEQLEPLSAEQQERLVAQLQPIADSLALGSIEDFAALRPQAAQLLAWLREQPWGQPYADWLAPRMDYLDLASEAVETSNRQWAEEQRRLRDPLLPVPSERPRPTLRFEVVRDRVYRSAMSSNTWTRRIAQRTAPPGAAALAPRLKAAFRAEGVAPEWIWLAEVESSFDPEARSPSGARGLFQFMPAAAKRFGLSLFPFDERTNPEKSARAAAQYLRFLHGKFGEWPLALAAYNAGEGRIGRELDKVKRRSFDEIAERLPAETRFYVPKVMATVAARENVDPFALPAPTASAVRGQEPLAVIRP